MKYGRVNPQNANAKSVVLLCIVDTLQAKYVEATLTYARHLVQIAEGPRALFDMLAEATPDAVVLGATNALFDGQTLGRLVRENTPYRTGPIYLVEPDGALCLIDGPGDEGERAELAILASVVGTPLSSAAA